MTTKTKISTLLFFFIILPFAFAASPGTPSGYYGTVTVDGSLSTGAVIDAYIDGSLSGTTYVGEFKEDIYSLSASRLDNATSDTVQFLVYGISAGTADFIALQVSEKNLNVNKTEDNESCPSDYTGIEPKQGTNNFAHLGCLGGYCVHGECASDLYIIGDGHCDTSFGEETGTVDCPKSSGGGGGRSASSVTCTPDWSCSDWSECSATGIQDRNCVDNNNCAGVSEDEMPAESRSCNYFPEEDTGLEGMLNKLMLSDGIRQDVLSDLGSLEDYITSSNSFNVVTGNDISRYSDELALASLTASEVEYAAFFEVELDDVNYGSIPTRLQESISEKLNDAMGYDAALDGDVEVSVTMTVVTFRTKDGNVISVVTFEYTVTSGDYVINVPKTVATTADELSGNFEVIENDPVLLYKDTGSITFSVVSEPRDVDNLESDSQDMQIMQVSEAVPVRTSLTGGEDDGSGTGLEGITGRVVGGDSGTNPIMGIFFILLIVCSAGVVVYRYAPPITAKHHLSRARILNKKADRHQKKGNTEKAGMLYSKAQEHRKIGKERLK